MLAKYIDKALLKAHYEIIEDEEPYYGEISSLPGVWASAKSLEECRSQLIEVLEGWILVRVRKGLPIPEIDNVTIKIPQEITLVD